MSTLKKPLFGPTPNYPLVLNEKPDFLDPTFIIAGPCAVELSNQIDIIYGQMADKVSHFRGGVFRAGTYPKDNYGLQFELLKEMHRISKKYKKPNVVDVLDIRQLEFIDDYVDVYQVGMRQSQHYALLTELGRQRKPVILKRGAWMTIHEFLGSAEYILRGGNRKLILCERGSVSYHAHCRYEVSISMIAMLKQITHFPVLVDASHGTGDSELVKPMTLAGIAAGADGFIIECHQVPSLSISDSEQIVNLNEVKGIIDEASSLMDILRGDL